MQRRRGTEADAFSEDDAMPRVLDLWLPRGLGGASVTRRPAGPSSQRGLGRSFRPAGGSPCSWTGGVCDPARVQKAMDRNRAQLSNLVSPGLADGLQQPTTSLLPLCVSFRIVSDRPFGLLWTLTNECLSVIKRTIVHVHVATRT